jgi:hypothetical protein
MAETPPKMRESCVFDSDELRAITAMSLTDPLRPSVM